MAAYRRAKEIARDLSISEHTVRGYADDARKKLGVPSSRDAALLFFEFERAESPPRLQGDQIQRVAEDRIPGPSIAGGFLNASQDGEAAIIQGNTTHVGTSRLQRLQGWLNRLGPLRWLALTLVVTLAVVTAFGFAVVSILGVFEVLQQIGAPHR